MIRVSTNKEHAMTGTIQIAPQDIFTDPGLRLLLGLPSATLARARREGRLRYTRRGKRIFYTGEWVVDWLVGGRAEGGYQPVMEPSATARRARFVALGEPPSSALERPSRQRRAGGRRGERRRRIQRTQTDEGREG
jgi:hypothetical protein